MNRNRDFHPFFIFPGLTTCTQNNWLKLADHCSELFATNNPCLRPELSLPFCCDNHILLLFNPALFLATQIASMSLNMKPWKKGALYLIFCKKKGSDDLCQSMGGTCYVKPILTSSSQPSDLSNYSLFLACWQRRLPVHGEGEVVFQQGPIPFNQWTILSFHLSNLIHVCVSSYLPYLTAIHFLRSSIQILTAYVCDMPVYVRVCV